MELFNELWEFIKNNVQILVNGAYLIMAVILLITRKKLPKSEKLTALEPILEELPEIIRNAEKELGSKTGFSKLILVLASIQERCEKKGIQYDEKYWTSKIEKILETPEKK